jgi:hypothetical protein
MSGKYIFKNKQCFKVKNFRKKELLISNSNKFNHTVDDEIILRQMFDFYIKYCRENKMDIISNLNESISSYKMEMYQKTILYVRNHKLKWEGDNADFLKRLEEMPDDIIYFKIKILKLMSRYHIGLEISSPRMNRFSYKFLNPKITQKN